MFLTLRTAATVFGCSCFEENKHSAQDLVFSPFVFEGKIIATRLVTPEGTEGMIKALFRVERWLSPDSGLDTISIYTPQQSCGLGFGVDETWLIFAKPFNKLLTSIYCDRSVLVDHSEDSRKLLRFFRNLSTGTHDVNIELTVWSGPYHLIGKLADGEPIGTWVKLRGVDTLAFYNFQNGTQVGMQMETDEETSPPERYYFRITQHANQSVTFTKYDNHLKPIESCEYSDGPSRIRYQSPGPVMPQYNLSSNFKIRECKETQKPKD